MKKTILALFLSAGLTSFAVTAKAKTYDNYSDWSNAVTGISTVPVDNPSGNFNQYPLNTLLTLGNVGFVMSALGNASPGVGLYILSSSIYAVSPNTKPLLSPEGDTPLSLLMTLPSAFTALSLNFDYVAAPGSLTFNISNGDSYLVTNNYTQGTLTGFFGVTSSTPFNQVTIVSSGQPGGGFDLGNILT